MKLYSNARGWIIWLLIVLCILIYTLVKNADAEETKSIIFAVDVSSSVSNSEYKLQKEAYVALLKDPEVQLILEGTEVSIIEFASTAKTIVPFTNNLNSAAFSYEHKQKPEFIDGTNPYSAIWLAVKLFKDKLGEKVLDISGDGAFNGKDLEIPEPWRSDTPKILHELGIKCNALVFGSTQDRIHALPFYRDKIITGFYVVAETAEDFKAALKRKIITEISQNF